MRWLFGLCVIVVLFAVADASGGTIRYVPPWPWVALADCESGDGDGRKPYRATWHYNGSSGFDGGYQFLPRTWKAAIKLVPGWQPAYAYRASARVQTRVAVRWQRATSWHQWPTCARLLGLI